jgi:hypothetical protein
MDDRLPASDLLIRKLCANRRGDAEKIRTREIPFLFQDTGGLEGLGQTLRDFYMGHPQAQYCMQS